MERRRNSTDLYIHVSPITSILRTLTGTSSYHSISWPIDPPQYDNRLQSILFASWERNAPTKQRKPKAETCSRQRKHWSRLPTRKPGSSLRLAYELVKKANKQSHVNNKEYYDKNAKQRSFQLRDKVYLYNPARKVGKCFKFHKFWTGPF
jgi:hypothetical protein